MAHRNVYTCYEKYQNTEKGRNYMRGILACICLRDGIAGKVDREVKKQFDGLVIKKMKKIKKLQQSGDLKCSKCNDYKALCSACKTIFDEQMFLEIRHIVGRTNVCMKNSKGIANHCDFAKAFIKLGGYLEVKTIQEIDCHGLMEIVVNNKGIEQYFGNIRAFGYVRDHRGIIHHREGTLGKEPLDKALVAMSQLLNEQKDMLLEEAKARQQQESTSIEVHSEGELLKNKLKIHEEESDIEEDACPEEYVRDENKDDLATASYKNSCSEMSQSDGLSKKMDEALEYLEELKRVNYRFTTNDEIEFLKENLFVFKREKDNIDQSNSDKIEKIAKEMENLKLRIAELENSLDGNSSCDVSDRANSDRGELDQPRDTSNSSVCSSMPSKNWEDDIRLYEKVMPAQLQLGYVDVLILHNEEDTESAFKFQEHLQNDIKLDDGEKIKAILAGGPELTACSRLHFEQLEIGFHQSTFIFIYVTKKLISETWDKFVVQCFLKKKLSKKNVELNVFAIYSEKPSETFEIPLQLEGLTRLDYYINDVIYRKKVSTLISSKIGKRKLKDEEHKIEQKKWIEEHKKKIDDLKKRQRQVE